MWLVWEGQIGSKILVFGGKMHLKDFDIAPEILGLEDEFPFGLAIFSGANC